jgi:hypothetical protein
MGVAPAHPGRRRSQSQIAPAFRWRTPNEKGAARPLLFLPAWRLRRGNPRLGRVRCCCCRMTIAVTATLAAAREGPAAVAAAAACAEPPGAAEAGSPDEAWKPAEPECPGSAAAETMERDSAEPETTASSPAEPETMASGPAESETTDWGAVMRPHLRFPRDSPILFRTTLRGRVDGEATGPDLRLSEDMKDFF